MKQAAIICSLLLSLCGTAAHAAAPASTVITAHDALSNTCAGNAGVIVNLQTTNFHLLVGAPEMLIFATRHQACQVAGPVEALSAPLGMGDEAGGGIDRG